MNSLEELLVNHGVKPTPQRMVIAEFVMNTREHPTADQILQNVADRLPVCLSRATVYNTLNTLVEAGVLREVFTEPGPARYDANMDKHHHFVDTRTGRIFDIPWQEVPQLPKELAGKYKVHGYQITFFGEMEGDS
jgi:Fe2+ or Zn2+ uptake regulation protein